MSQKIDEKLKNLNESELTLYKVRHSAEHVLMQAMESLGYKLYKAMGPATEDGFYFDFEILEGLITEDDFPRIEDQMAKVVSQNLPITRTEITVEKARELFFNNPYKQEWINEAESRGETISVYWTGEPEQEGSFVDLCAGPHVESTGQIKAFKLLSIAGAYWRGNENNKMLTRIYGTAFGSKDELEKYTWQIEEAKKRDHRKLGKELDLFTFSDLVGAGLPLFTPKGTALRNELYNALLQISRRYKMLPVTIPHFAKIKLYEISGHAAKFSGELFRVISHYDEEFVLKPVNCPHHTQIYASRPRSYRELPLRYMESTMQHRDEKPGEIGGLTRTRSFTVDDGHIFCRVDQIKDEAKNICHIIKEFYTGLGMYGNHWVSLSVRDYQHPEKYIGDPADWDQAEAMLQEISDELGLKAQKMEGEAAIYGPKLDYMFKDSLGNERQLATVQVDFAMPKRFQLTYTDPNGQDATPVMIHRAILGSYERFLAILIEHFAGAFPVWLHPTQVQVIPIGENQLEYAYQIQNQLLEQIPDLRIEIDESNETLQKKIRNAQMEKIPYMIIVGGKEQENKTINVRLRSGETLGELAVAEFNQRIGDKIQTKALDL